MPKSIDRNSSFLVMLLCLLGCSTDATAPTNKPSNAPVTNEGNETPTGDETPVVPAEPQPAEQKPMTWKPFSPPGGGYSVLLPGAAQVLPSNRETIKNHGVQLTDGRIYMVSESQQSQFDDPDEIAETLAAARDAHLGGKPALFNEEVLLDDDKGYAYAFVDGDDVWEARIFLKGDRLYQLYAVVPKTTYAKGDSDVARFFDSFRILDPQKRADERKP